MYFTQQFFFRVPKPCSNRHSKPDGEACSLSQRCCRCLRLLLELQFLWYAGWTSDISTSRAVLENVFWCLDATATRIVCGVLQV